VAVVLDDPFAEVDRTVQDQLSAVARFLDSEGAHVSVGARPPFDSEELYHLYMILLRSATSLAMTDDEYERETANARGYDRATRNVERTNSYGATLSHRDWLRFDLERRRYRAQWNTFFEQFDVLLCLVFGLSLSVASTVVLLRALEQRNAVTSPEGRIAVGWLIVEDLAMVFALVLLPAFAELLDGRAGGTHASLWISLGWTLGKVTLFVAAALVIGTRLVPWMLAQVARTGSRELFTLSVLAVALGIATGSAILFDVSFALGAFFAGVILSESDLSHKAAEDSLPLQNAFAVLFFVSVGMLFDPGILVREPWAVLNVVLVIVVGKSLAAFLIVLAFRFPMETALTVSASLAQIGEFSFILAGLGMALGLLPPEAQNLILAGAILSIALNPIVFAAIGPLLRVLRTSPRVAGILERRSAPAGPSSTELLPPMKGHAIVVGHGRVGGDITPVLRLEGLPFVVIERDRRTYEDLRAGGVRAVYGDASARGVLQLADVGSARILVIASPDGYQTRRILELSRAANPDIQTIVRTHSETELEYLKRQHVGFVLMAERELALRLTEHILRGFGVPPARARQLVEPDVSVPAPVAQGRSSPQRHR
jgi:CPA2 family monovalent cation:H+ antiporter-2